MRIHCILHETFEGLASINDWILKNNHTVSFTHTYLKESFPDVNSFELLIIMGGTASVYEEEKYTWLIEEKRFIHQAIINNRKILGICLGAQLLADILNAKVYKGPEKEIGWFPVHFNQTEMSGLSFLPEKQTVFHWHGDTFDIPDHATKIGFSEAIPNQGFVYNDKIIALQFHLEMNENQVRLMLSHGKKELTTIGKYIQGENQILENLNFFADNNRLMYAILDYLALK